MQKHPPLSTQLSSMLRLMDDESAEIQKILRDSILENALEIVVNKNRLYSGLEGGEIAIFNDFLQQLHSELVYRAFGQLLSRSRDDVDLEAGVCIISYWYDRDVSCQSQQQYLDRIAREIGHKLPEGAGGVEMVGQLSNYLSSKESFRGNAADYYNPENSILHRVLETRLGIPISLSAVYLLVAKRLGIPLLGVAMPGHFILKYDDGGEEVFFDPYNGGRISSRTHCLDMLKQLNTENPEQILRGCTHQEILARMLRNLAIIYRSYANEEGKVAELERFLGLFGESKPEER